MRQIYIAIILLSGINGLYAQSKQPIPPNFINRVVSNGEIWKAIAYDRVQVKGSSKPIDKGYILFKENQIEIVDQNNSKVTVSYTIEPGIVDPILKTSDGKEYEVRFYSKPPTEFMRLRCIKSPNGLQYFEAITYKH